LCKPKLEKQILTNINSIKPDASVAAGRWTVVRGEFTALLGMGDPAPGQASAHHLILAKYDFICWVSDSHVKKTVVKRLR
jgi:hypothetical protein